MASGIQVMHELMENVKPSGKKNLIGQKHGVNGHSLVRAKAFGQSAVR